jgi:hypothetical protein
MNYVFDELELAEKIETSSRTSNRETSKATRIRGFK